MKSPRVLTGRKILVASIGVATVTYACDSGSSRPETSGNLLPPPEVPMQEAAPADAGSTTGDR